MVTNADQWQWRQIRISAVSITTCIRYWNISSWRWIHAFNILPCMKSYKFWSLLQCTVPESAATVWGPVSWLSPETQPELPQWRYPHYPLTTVSTFQKPSVLVCKEPHCLVFRPKVQFQGTSRSQDHTSRLWCSRTTSATVPQMECLSWKE